MSIKHKFYHTNFTNEYVTNNAILDTTPYKPEVLILGTFNPSTPKTNLADFYYGRNFFWPAFKNLFVTKQLIIQKRRMPQNGNSTAFLDPSLLEIFEICSHLKLTFADLVLEVFHLNNPDFQLLQNDNIIFNQQEFNLIQDGRKGNINGLHQLNTLQQVHWNTKNIIQYLCENPQIKSIYFTRRPTGIWAKQWEQIITHEYMDNRNFTNIFTPSGQGKPIFHSMAKLLNHWLHNGNKNFGTLDKNWLIKKGVNINNH